MKIYGISFIRNGMRLGYPFRESIQSVLPLVEKFYIAVGDSQDTTRKEVEALGNKVHILDTVWDTSPRNGLILSEQTNLALQQVPADADFILCLQGDEVLHEEDYSILRSDFQAALSKNFDGILFHYIHFYGNTQTVQYTATTYRREVRAIRLTCKNVGDGQSYRLKNGEKPKVYLSKARIFHYGWAREENLMVAKTATLDSFYHSKDLKKSAKYKRLIGLYKFDGTHPSVMKHWIDKNSSTIDPLKLPLLWTWKDFKKIISDFIEYWTGLRIGEYKSYRL